MIRFYGAIYMSSCQPHRIVLKFKVCTGACHVGVRFCMLSWNLKMRANCMLLIMLG